MDFAAKTETGKKRGRNEDCYFVSSLKSAAGDEVGIFIVADGVGGAQRGDLASYLACNRIGSELSELLKGRALSQSELKEALARSIREANRKLHRSATDARLPEGMATTLVVAVQIGRELLIANVGDSRAYILTDRVQQVTVDHSLVQEMVDSGMLSPDAAPSHPQRNVITRALGLREEVDIDFFSQRLDSADPVIVLCTDGLYSLVDLNRFLPLGTVPLSETVDRLVRAANDGGGHDNITACAIGPARPSSFTVAPQCLPRAMDETGALPGREGARAPEAAAEPAGIGAGLTLLSRNWKVTAPVIGSCLAVLLVVMAFQPGPGPGAAERTEFIELSDAAGGGELADGSTVSCNLTANDTGVQLIRISTHSRNPLTRFRYVVSWTDQCRTCPLELEKLSQPGKRVAGISNVMPGNSTEVIILKAPSSASDRTGCPGEVERHLLFVMVIDEGEPRLVDIILRLSFIP